MTQSLNELLRKASHGAIRVCDTRVALRPHGALLFPSCNVFLDQGGNWELEGSLTLEHSCLPGRKKLLRVWGFSFHNLCFFIPSLLRRPMLQFLDGWVNTLGHLWEQTTSNFARP